MQPCNRGTPRDAAALSGAIAVRPFSGTSSPSANAAVRPRGTHGYAEHATELIARYDAIGFVEKHRPALSFIPARPSRVLDVGAGTGADAAWFAGHGHEVVAVEPTAEFRAYAHRKYASPRIEWIDDHLPRLEAVVMRRQSFDVIVLSAVWMHLDEEERRTAMPILASLLSRGGVMLMSLRHGPIPEGRVMFDASPEETLALAGAAGLEAILSTRSASVQAANAAAGVTWSNLAFAKPRE